MIGYGSGRSRYKLREAKDQRVEKDSFPCMSRPGFRSFYGSGIDTNNGRRFGARVEPALIMIGLKLLVTQVLSTSYS